MTTTLRPFPIVGIGASAGGLQALEILFRRMPADTGMAFVVVTHLPSGRASAMAEILQRYTEMPVASTPADTMVVPNQVYVCPPDQVLTIADGRLRLRARAPQSHDKLIDAFLGSLAGDRGEAAIGILLSGSGTDGTLGIKCIRECGGLTLAQGHDGCGPAYAEMPDAAIAAGVVDLVLPVEEMPARIVAFVRGAPTVGDAETEIAQEIAPDDATAGRGYQAIHEILRKQFGHDFSGYKQRTFQRRVWRRLQLLQVPDPLAYAERLRESAAEATRLFQDLLIGVTDFFRDPEAFDALETLVVPHLFAGKGADDAVRVWVPACATGEEAYSIAILLREHTLRDDHATLHSAPKVQVFATDIDEAALTVARAGRYPAQLLRNIREEWLLRHFTVHDGLCTVAKDVREMCVFSPHSVLRDPPFSRLDLISCRNLLIYFGSRLQDQVIPIFHHALKPDGYLLLGSSENVGQHRDLFAPVDKKQRIFQRRDHVIAPVRLPALVADSSITVPAGADHPRRGPVARATGLRLAVEARVIDRFAPAHVVVNPGGDILHYSPRTGKYLEPAAGIPNRQMLAMARKGLRADLRDALHEAVQTGRTAERKNLEVELDDRVQKVDLLIEPLGGREGDPLFLVLFKDVGPPSVSPEAARGGSDGDDLRVTCVEQELRDTRERLQATIEEYETALEEVKSSNEELQSVNEELQSTNEELETSKEELQSLNEELHAVNAELNAKIEEVDRANSDLRNIFESTQIAIVFLDRDLVIRSFTPAATAIFNLISTDRGRPLTDIVGHLEDGDMRRDIRIALERGEIIERNVRRRGGQAHYLMRILPYRGIDAVIEGVLVIFVDVTRIVRSETHQLALVDELSHRVRGMLGSMSAIATITLPRSVASAAFVETFTGRIDAMGAAYALIAEADGHAVALRDIVQAQARAAGLQGADRMATEGATMSFKPTWALALGLVLHELATNAMRHGALAKTDGRVLLTSAVEAGDAPAVVLRWREAGGAAARKPAKKGFGMELIERELHAIGGTIKFSYVRSGFSATLSLPFDSTHVLVGTS